MYSEIAVAKYDGNMQDLVRSYPQCFYNVPMHGLDSIAAYRKVEFEDRVEHYVMIVSRETCDSKIMIAAIGSSPDWTTDMMCDFQRLVKLKTEAPQGNFAKGLNDRAISICKAFLYDLAYAPIRPPINS